MKALNRAIARTTGHIIDLCAFHIDRTGTQGCAVKQTPETLKQLEQHLAALLEMERKQLEQAGTKVASIGAVAVDVFASNLSALQQQLAEKSTPLQPHASDNAQAVTSAPQEPPSLPPHDWREGDALVCVTHALASFVKGGTYRILRISPAGQCIVRNHDGHERDISNFAVRHFKNYTRREAAA